MKKHFLLMPVVIFTLLFTTCSLFTPILTISNNSSVDLYSATWNGTLFIRLDKGNKDECHVDPGSGYIFFKVWGSYDGIKEGRTQELVKVKDSEKKTFTFTDSTMVIGTGVTSKPLTLLEFTPK